MAEHKNETRINFSFTFLLFLHLSLICKINCIQFNRNVTGVAFSAYVRFLPPTVQDPSIDWKRYTQNDIKTLLKVISGRFSKIATFGVGSSKVAYQENTTYYHQSFAEVYSAETAAILNKEENKQLLSIVVGVWIYRDSVQMNTEVQLALESARKANTIYPGTVPGLVFTENDIATNMEQARITLAQIQMIKNQATEQKLKLGSRQSCHGINTIPLQTGQLAEIRREIVKNSDFIICTIDSNQYASTLGVSDVFDQVKRDIVRYKDDLRRLNPSIEVMAQTGFATANGQTKFEVDTLKNYWVMVDAWAAENNFPVWLFEAFDNPWKTWDAFAANYGWWKLKANTDVSSVEGYIEKISTITTSSTTTTIKPTKKDDDENGSAVNATNTSPGDTIVVDTSVWTYVAVAISLIVLLIVMGLFTILYRRFNKLRDVLSKKEIMQFMYGGVVNNEDAAASIKVLCNEQENGSNEMPAMSKPYDKSYEICKDNLEIAWTSILGSGQFGCVYKAILNIPHKGKMNVALKMARSDCPKNVVKSLLSEIKILIHLGEHSNLVPIRGAYTAEIHKGIVYVATELCELGSLKSYLREKCQRVVHRKNTNTYTELECDSSEQRSNENTNNENTQVPVSEMVRWSYEISCGMEYLGIKHVVHADLATRNVLLTSDKTTKITDFGLSRRLYDYSNYVKKQQEPLPWRWMSVESLKKLEFSSKSDVWSYGVTLWEIFSGGDVPYAGLSWDSGFVSSLESGLRMQCPQFAAPEIFDLMSVCWEKEPQDRPTFSQLKSNFIHIVESIKK